MKRLALLLLCSLPVAFAQQNTGSICGTVENELGQPAATIKIIAMPAAVGGMVPRFKTDSTGHYCATGLTVPGGYTLSADDADAGYPSLVRGFYDQKAPANIQLTAEKPVATFNWRIPYKAATVRIHPADESTGKPLESVRYSLVLKNDPGVGILTSSSPVDLPILLPPNTDLLLQVTAPGYRPWPNDGSQGHLLNSPSGLQTDLDVYLQAQE